MDDASQRLRIVCFAHGIGARVGDSDRKLLRMLRAHPEVTFVRAWRRKSWREWSELRRRPDWYFMAFDPNE